MSNKTRLIGLNGKPIGPAQDAIKVNLKVNIGSYPEEIRNAYLDISEKKNKKKVTDELSIDLTDLFEQYFDICLNLEHAIMLCLNVFGKMPQKGDLYQGKEVMRVNHSVDGIYINIRVDFL